MLELPLARELEKCPVVLLSLSSDLSEHGVFRTPHEDSGSYSKAIPGHLKNCTFRYPLWNNYISLASNGTVLVRVLSLERVPGFAVTFEVKSSSKVL